MKTKICSKCKIEKSVFEFNKNSGHTDGYESQCDKCSVLRVKKWRKKNPEKVKEQNKRYQKKHPLSLKWKTCKVCNKLFTSKASRLYCSSECKEIEENQQKIKRNQLKKSQGKWFGNWTKEKYNEYQRMIRKNPRTNLRYNMASLMSQALKGEKAGAHWETLMWCSQKDLMKCLEKQFEPWMNWKNHGNGRKEKNWSIDHWVPDSWFEYLGPDDPEFKISWNFKNLRPLWTTENSQKLNRGNIEILVSYLISILKTC